MSKKNYFFIGTILAAVLFAGALASAEQADTTAPSAVSNLAASAITHSSVILSWTAPGDDGAVGTSTSYDMRYSTSLINESNFSSSNQVTGEPTPKIAGSAESMTVSGLSASTTYYFALKSRDEVPNVSVISNIVTITTLAAPDTTAPSAINNLSVTNITQSSVTLAWSAPGDDGFSGTASSYDMRYSTSLITSVNWSSATQASGEPSPLAAGTTQSLTVSGLSSSTTYYFAIKTKDEVPNESALSNVTSATTLAPSAPSPTPSGTAGFELKVTPHTLNLGSQGGWISVQLFISSPHNLRDIDIGSLRLNGTLQPDSNFRGTDKFSKGKDDKGRTVSNLLLKFYRAQVQGLIGSSSSGTFILTLTGTIGGQSFSASDTINILQNIRLGGDDDNDCEGCLLQSSSSPDVYIIINGKKRHIPSAQAFERMRLRWQEIRRVGQEILDAFLEDELIRAEGTPQVYIIINGFKRHIPSPAVFSSYGFNWGDISTVSASVLADYPTASLIRSAGDDKVYFLSGGQKHWVKSLSAFNKRGFSWGNVIIVNSAERDAIPGGTDLQ
ncbi:MAG: hypothetical protein A2Y98_01920 [Candidatus Portnoybacteria bacterium RBG_19FT_COMBO_36_7]|uniref:Fibronectin type-III domain-containing protein n=1 Tax=Candidatus Portnoybacteria bacterium RBG_19FT_COMBO_36_7 TaxID=1801992 RepID=A0A1G2F7R7_9BACT|nr:MAG: hypothetical protein A2Y98_01920 [Candidatus Portnoybacteria bacterium RBG_19FT_COMBO_36_7]